MDPAAYAELLDLILAQSVFGVFMMRFDEPITWDAEADREALLDYAWTHLRVVLANEATCRQLGVTREALLGTTPATRWSGGREQWRAHAAKMFDQGRLHHSARVPPDYGGARDFEGDYICTYDAEGRITGYVGVQQDISDARRVSEELVDSQRRLALALAGGEISVWDHDLVTNTVYFDREQLVRLGYQNEPLQLPQEWWEQLVHPADLPKMVDAFRAHAAGRAPLYRIDYRLRTARGDWAWLQ